MARSRPTGPPNGQQPMQLNHGVTMEAHEYSDDPRANSGSCSVAQGPQARSSCIAQVATLKQGETGEGVAIPTPIAQTCWKVISPSGHEQLCYQPIPGFEHLWNGPTPLQGTSGFAASPESLLQSHQPTTTPVPGQTPDEPKAQQNPRKRTRSSRRRLRSEPVVQTSSDEAEDGQYNRDVKIMTEQSYTFYIGDITGLKRFLRRRLDELTMKPLRPIVTAWIKQFEPRRLSRYGPYHKKFPRELPPECTPPWWPSDVRYEEPSHLDKEGLLNLAVDIMLQHRLIDKEKRKGSWVAKLRQAAQYAVETTPPDQFSSSKGSGFSERMQSRALAEILPNLFETAQLFEDHLAYHGHYEGSGIPDPGRGKRITWQPLTRPARKPIAPRKCHRRSKRSPDTRPDTDTDQSEDETEMDDNPTVSYLSGEQLLRDKTGELNNLGLKGAQTQALVPTREVVAAPFHTYPYGVTATPSISFERPVDDFPHGNPMDLDVKVAARTPPYHQIYTNGSHAAQYSNSRPNYSQPTTEFQQESCAFSGTSQSRFTQDSAPVYHHPFHAFNAQFAHPVQHALFHDDPCSPHRQEAYAPSSNNMLNLFQGTAHSASIKSHAEVVQY